ncbi:MAG: MoaD/ThiS family protein [Dehalococcoidia bacterium]|jgi:molybdopterin converting factor small subunit
MSVKVLIPSLLHKYTDNKEVVEVEGTTVNDCIDALKNRYPELERWLYRSGKVATYVHIGVNNKKASINDRVADGDEIKVMLATGGG